MSLLVVCPSFAAAVCNTVCPPAINARDNNTTRCNDNYLLIMSDAIICSACDCNAISVELSHDASPSVAGRPAKHNSHSLDPAIIMPLVVGQLWHLDCGELSRRNSGTIAHRGVRSFAWPTHIIWIVHHPATGTFHSLIGLAGCWTAVSDR